MLNHIKVNLAKNIKLPHKTNPSSDVPCAKTFYKVARKIADNMSAPSMENNN